MRTLQYRIKKNKIKKYPMHNGMYAVLRIITPVRDEHEKPDIITYTVVFVKKKLKKYSHDYKRICTECVGIM